MYGLLFATDTYASDAMTIYGFSIEYSLSGNDASSFCEAYYF